MPGDPRRDGRNGQLADIVHGGWEPAEFFEALTPGGSDLILGVTFTFTFVDDQGTPDPADDVPTDINGDGKGDVMLREIYHNPVFIYTNRGAPNFVDFFSVLAHESDMGSASGTSARSSSPRMTPATAFSWLTSSWLQRRS